MKILLNLPLWPEIKIEGPPHEIAQLLQELRVRDSSDKRLPQEKKLQPSPQDSQKDLPSLSTDEPGPKRTLSAKEMPANRRDMVLEAMAELRNAGEEASRIHSIVALCKERFPSINSKHLDQVIRDLANKTRLVESPSRGLYRLTDSP